MSITISDSVIRDGSWDEIDKQALAEQLLSLGDPRAIRETYLIVGDITKSSTWKFPHHIIEAGELKVHAGGVEHASKHLIALGQNTSNIAKRAAAKQLVKHFGVDSAPSPELHSMSKYVCYEEAFREQEILNLMNIGVASSYPQDYFDAPCSSYKDFTDFYPDFEQELKTLPVLGVSYKEIELEDIISEIESIVDGTEAKDSNPLNDGENEDDDNDDEEESKQAKELRARVRTKSSGNVELMDDLHTLAVKRQVKFTNRGKQAQKDYEPTPDELYIINAGYSRQELTPQDLFVFNLESANMDVDRDNEHFSEDALKSMARMSLDKPLLTDHEWKNDNTVGKIFAADVQDGKLMQKVYILNDPMNHKLIRNMMAGIYNKVSVGFSTNLEDNVCDSCGSKSIYDSSCPHIPGGLDEKGTNTSVCIKGIKDYFEVSLVPVPAQREARIGRRSMTLTPEMQKSFGSPAPMSEALLGVPPVQEGHIGLNYGDDPETSMDDSSDWTDPEDIKALWDKLDQAYSGIKAATGVLVIRGIKEVKSLNTINHDKTNSDVKNVATREVTVPTNTIQDSTAKPAEIADANATTAPVTEKTGDAFVAEKPANEADHIALGVPATPGTLPAGAPANSTDSVAIASADPAVAATKTEETSVSASGEDLTDPSNKPSDKAKMSKLIKSLKKVVREQKKLLAEYKAINEQTAKSVEVRIASVEAAQDSQAKQVTLLNQIVEFATKNSMQSLERGAAVHAQVVTSTKAEDRSGNSWAFDLSKNMLGLGSGGK